jgi:hypothetical protein
MAERQTDVPTQERLGPEYLRGNAAINVDNRPRMIDNVRLAAGGHYRKPRLAMLRIFGRFGFFED